MNRKSTTLTHYTPKRTSQDGTSCSPKSTTVQHSPPQHTGKINTG